MREILFRGKSVDTGTWRYGDLKHWLSGAVGICCEVTHNTIKVLPETVGQYTGLTGTNGKKIFEGDIVIFKTTNYHFEPCVVEYHNDTAQFVVSKNGRSYPMADDFNYEVIGNIHDNPEMIGGKEE